MPISDARISIAATAGADVKLTASNFSSAMPATNWSKSPLRGDRMPPVHPDRHHLGARRAQLVEELRERIPGIRGAVELHRDALAGDTALDQVVQQLAGRLRLRRPLLGQTRGAQRSRGLRARARRCVPCPAR